MNTKLLIGQLARKYIRTHNTKTIIEAIEDTTNMKILKSKRSCDKNTIINVKNKIGNVISDRKDIFQYRKLPYASLNL